MNGESFHEPSNPSSGSSSHRDETSPSEDEAPSSSSAISGPVVVRIGAAIMVLSSLLSWVDWFGDGFPHITGIGITTSGTGLAVFVLGLSLLFWNWPIGITLGKALGAFSVTVVFFSLVRPSSGYLGAGAWISLMGTAIALVGAVLVAGQSTDQAKLEIANLFRAGFGAALAIVASVWFDWVTFSWLRIDAGVDAEPLTGVDPDVSYGIPVLIFASVVLVLITVVVSDLLTNNKLVTLLVQVAGIAITVVAGANVLGNMVLGWTVFGSAPVVALAGGILLTSAVREPNS
ncbi:MAG: hypothetical protein F4Y27_13550 [Acidimicrobiaceae bacterium]|nr:hypothetical protein [Acidimicrobiaceae bacterium]MYA75687.1 hypothetical protein [Acidimicrobiaceae bacterium]MYC42954.1 hypothetical protein [Acidimicrobiaceae bacterium]MYG55705.1 hypothetical protein [Acidimicrobiaceae bacterium]MYJ98361.1 hypothetical protein [Acidimicrobiaceae bacterium]